VVGMSKSVLALVAVAVLGGCANWPPAGYGGAAEQVGVRADDTHERLRLISTQRDLSLLRARNGIQLMPAAMETAAVQWVRAARATDGGFTEAARIDLTRLEQMLSALRLTLNVAPPPTAEPVDAQNHEVKP
jgi:hypothetical protein